MSKPIAIIAGEPNGIGSEIIFKSWLLRNKYQHKSFFVIGNVKLLNKQKKKLKYKIKIKEINIDSFNKQNLKNDHLLVYNVDYKQKKSFEKISSNSNNYILECFDVAIKLALQKKIIGMINCPVSKEFLFKKKHQGITEFLSTKTARKGNEVMLIYNKNLSVSPITTHIALKKVSSKIKKNNIIKKIIIIEIFYKKIFKFKPKFGILGLNPHNFMHSKKAEESTIISKAINELKKLKINVSGPIPTDSSFMIQNKSNFDVIIGMYHDQVLTPFKALYNYQAINITLGLPFIRVSPDHGVAKDIAGKKLAISTSMIESIKFFNNIK